MNQNQPEQEESKPISKIEIVISIALAFIIFAIGYYIVLNTEESIAKYPDAICCAPIQINWIALLLVIVLSIILGIVLQHPCIRTLILGDKHERDNKKSE